jgi:MYXO-CTERM domain-containing protein
MRSRHAHARSSRFVHRLALAAMGVTLAGVGAACSGPPDGLAPEAVGSSQQAITGSTIVSRADQWVTAKLLYCQSANGAPDYDPSCPSTCVRENNPAWNPYRSDCSGFVSWAWDLPSPGRTTSEFAPADTTVSYAIDGNDMEPGDAVNIPGDHMVLFVSWVTPGTEANFYEEPGCSATPDYAHAFTSTVSITGTSVYIDYEGASFTAIRYTGVTGAGEAGASAADAGVPCTVTATGDMGICMNTSVCATMGGTSTADYCPGPADIQCCTGIPAPVEDAGGPGATDSGSGSTEHDSGSGTGPGKGGGDGGTLPPMHGGDGGGVLPDDDAGRPGDRGAGKSGESGGCSTSPSRGAAGGEGGLLVLGAVGLAGARRRRRRDPRCSSARG